MAKAPKANPVCQQALYPDIYYEYQPEFGVWSVYFENFNELSIGKITKIFKKYGTIKNVSQTGSSQGYCFVSYWLEEDAKNCVLQSSRDGIKLRSFSPKIRRMKDKRLSEDSEIFEVMKKKPLRSGNVTQCCNNNDNNNSKIDGTPHNDQHKYENYYENKSVFFANTKKLSKNRIRQIFSKYGHIETVQQTGPATGWCFVRFVSEQCARKCAMDAVNNNIIPLEKFESISTLRARRQEKRMRKEMEQYFSNNSDDFYGSLVGSFEDSPGLGTQCFQEIEPEIWSKPDDKMENNREKMLMILKKHTKDLPKTVQKVIMVSGKYFYVPMDSRIPWKKLKTVVVEDVHAERIIVANIHETCDADFFGKLFEKYQPIFVTKIKEIGNGSLNYCHVYVQTDSFASAAVKNFDNLNVYGKNLIVVRPESLIDG